MPRRSIATFDRVRIVTLFQEGLSLRELPRRLWMNQSDVLRTWGGTEIQELSMTCVAQAAQSLLLQLLTATYGFQLGGTLKATPPFWIMLFLQPQDIVFRLKLYKIACMMLNFTPGVHGEVHIWHLDTMQRGTDGPKNTLNGIVRIGIKLYSQMSVACAFNQKIVGDVFGGSLVRLNVSDTLSSKVVVPDVLGWRYVWPTYATGGHGKRWNGNTIQELHPPTYTATISAEFREELVLMDDNSHPHHAYFVNEFLHDNNIAKLEWPICSPDMNPINHAWDTLKRAVFGRDDPPTTLRDLRRFTIEKWDNLDQQDLDELVDSRLCHVEYRHASMQEGMLLGIRSTGLCCNLAHKFKKSCCIIVQLAVFGSHEQYRGLKCCSCLSLFHLYVKVQELSEPRWYKSFFFICVYIRDHPTMWLPIRPWIM